MNNTDKNICKGRVSAIYKNSYIIRLEGRDIPSRLKGSFQEKDPEQFPVVGDYVSFINNLTIFLKKSFVYFGQNVGGTRK